ncbi:MAG TPA: hypothetical protein VMA73_28125 [Streptosporangiaceae bacterium]|nr:hypothetical protein [Streptosporangiaceae bacterium]
MNSDPTDGAAGVDPGTSGDRGIDQLFRILTTGPAPDELAGEQGALAMFRATISPLAGPAPVNGPRVNGTPVNGTTVPIPGHGITSPKRSIRHPFRVPVRWGVRLAAAGVIAIGGTTAAAYAAALPAPVQNLAHHVLGIVGVPAAHHPHHTATSQTRGYHSGGPAGRSGTSSGRHSHPSQAAKPSPSAHSSASPSASPSSSTVTGSAVLSASASTPDIMGGTAPVIDGQLTRAGTGVSGVTVTLVERLAGHPLWHVAGTAQTTSGGFVAITGPPLATNAAFRLRFPGGVHSASVLVTVTPQVAVVLTPGASGLRDLLTVTTQYAKPRNVVWLQVQSASGGWVNLRSKRLNAAGKTWFILSGKNLENKTVQVVLMATIKHGSAVSNSETVPEPS